MPTAAAAAAADDDDDDGDDCDDHHYHDVLHSGSPSRSYGVPHGGHYVSDG
jgi:hypothetical protein